MSSISTPLRIGNPFALLDAALDYHQRGFTILPATGKRPKLQTWKEFQTARPSESVVRDWFTLPDVTGIAVLLGNASGGLHCRDFDSAPAYYRWAGDHADLARILPTSQTGKGNHVFLRWETEAYAKYDDGEYRGTRGHYIIAPPSLHPDGGKYRWLIPPANVIPLIDPSTVGLLLQSPVHTSTPPFWCRFLGNSARRGEARFH
jgi:hypothetical protein